MQTASKGKGKKSASHPIVNLNAATDGQQLNEVPKLTGQDHQL